MRPPFSLCLTIFRRAGAPPSGKRVPFFHRALLYNWNILTMNIRPVSCRFLFPGTLCLPRKRRSRPRVTGLFLFFYRVPPACSEDWPTDNRVRAVGWVPPPPFCPAVRPPPGAFPIKECPGPQPFPSLLLDPVHGRRCDPSCRRRTFVPGLVVPVASCTLIIRPNSGVPVQVCLSCFSLPFPDFFFPRFPTPGTF